MVTSGHQINKSTLKQQNAEHHRQCNTVTQENNIAQVMISTEEWCSVGVNELVFLTQLTFTTNVASRWTAQENNVARNDNHWQLMSSRMRQCWRMQQPQSRKRKQSRKLISLAKWCSLGGWCSIRCWCNIDVALDADVIQKDVVSESNAVYENAVPTLTLHPFQTK